MFRFLIFLFYLHFLKVQQSNSWVSLSLCLSKFIYLFFVASFTPQIMTLFWFKSQPGVWFIQINIKVGSGEHPGDCPGLEQECKILRTLGSDTECAQGPEKGEVGVSWGLTCSRSLLESGWTQKDRLHYQPQKLVSARKKFSSESNW